MIADILNMRFGRTAPMVAHAIKTHDMLQPWCHCLCSSQNLFREIGSKGDVRGHKPHAHDSPPPGPRQRNTLAGKSTWSGVGRWKTYPTQPAASRISGNVAG